MRNGGAENEATSEGALGLSRIAATLKIRSICENTL